MGVGEMGVGEQGPILVDRLQKTGWCEDLGTKVLM